MAEPAHPSCAVSDPQPGASRKILRPSTLWPLPDPFHSGAGSGPRCTRSRTLASRHSFGVSTRAHAAASAPLTAFPFPALRSRRPLHLRLYTPQPRPARAPAFRPIGRRWRPALITPLPFKLSPPSPLSAPPCPRICMHAHHRSRTFLRAAHICSD
jgi:hypothetical protein